MLESFSGSWRSIRGSLVNLDGTTGVHERPHVLLEIVFCEFWGPKSFCQWSSAMFRDLLKSFWDSLERFQGFFVGLWGFHSMFGAS